MRLYSGPLSLFARKIEIALAEKGLEFERVMVPFSQAAGYQPKHPDVLAANPKGQVPVLVDGDLTLFDSTVIFEYLEDAYPTPPLYPAGAAARARCRLIELTADEILLPPLRQLMHRSVPPDPDPQRRSAQEADAAIGEATLRGHYIRLAEWLGDDKDYFCGRFSVADIAVFMVLRFVRRLKGPDLSSHAALATWYGRMLARPSVAAISDELTAADRTLSPSLFARA
jgi:glutathione S-transferase